MPAALHPLAADGARPEGLHAHHRGGALALACLALLGLAKHARAQDSTPSRGAWVGVGAIGRTAMFMDTTSIERDGVIRRVWLESVSPEPTAFVVGRDTTRFDTVLALHVIDCHARTDAVATARYYLAGVLVAPPRPADTDPQRLRPGTFMAAVADDLCRGAAAAAPPTAPGR